MLARKGVMGVRPEGIGTRFFFREAGGGVFRGRLGVERGLDWED